MGQDSNPSATAFNNFKFDEEIDFIIGMPPSNPRDRTLGTFVGEPSRQDLMNNSMPVVHIQPGIPSFTRGLDLMSRAPFFISGADSYTEADLQRTGKRNSYVQQLRNLGFKLKQPKPNVTGYLTCAYLADNFPTDTFTNEYGENFLQKITNVASEGMASLAQMFGGRSGTQALENMIQQGKAAGGMVGTVFKGAESGMQGLKDLVNKLPSNSGLSRIANNLNVLAAGGRIDFPMLWKNSTYAPSYTMTIRLYNPNPNDDRATAKFIIGPVAALLLLGLPQSVGAGAYSWPYIHQFWSPGIYNLDPGYISNITVVKGGDQQQIAWKQRMGVVDVRIDFGSVFNSILSNAAESRNRPTLKGYLSALAGEKQDVVGVTDFQDAYNVDNMSRSDIEQIRDLTGNPTTIREINRHAKGRAGQRADQSPTQSKTQLDITEPGETITARISTDIKEIADNLIDLLPTGVRVNF